MRNFMYRAAAVGLCAVLSAGAPFMALADNPAPLTGSFTSSAPSTTAQNPIPVSITFSEPVTNFTEASPNISNGSITNFSSVSSSTYTFGIVPAAPQGSVSVDLNGGVVTGVDGQTNQAVPQLQFIYDPNAPDAATTTAPVPGCTDPGATNYNSAATQDDGSCTFAQSSGGSTTAPSVSITSPAASSTIASSSLEFDFTVNPADASTSCLFGDAVTPYDCGSPQIFGSDASPLPDGTYSFTVFAQNSAGEASSTVTVSYTFASSTAPVSGCTNPSATNYNSAATQDDGSCTLPQTSGGGTPAPSGGGGGGGGVIGGPLSVGYVNTNPYGTAVVSNTPAPVVMEQPGPVSSVVTGQVLGVSTSKKSGSSVAVAKKTPGASAPNPLAINTSTSSTMLGSSSSSTPGVPNTGANTESGPGTPVWLWVGIAAVLVILGGAWALLRSAP